MKTNFQGDKNRCFPSSAADYYNRRQENNARKDRICNIDYSTITSGSVPTYWRAMECGEDLHIGEDVMMRNICFLKKDF